LPLKIKKLKITFFGKYSIATRVFEEVKKMKL